MRKAPPNLTEVPYDWYVIGAFSL